MYLINRKGFLPVDEVHHEFGATGGRRQSQRQTNPADPPLIAWCVSMREVSGAAVGPTLQRGHYMGGRRWDCFRRWPYIKAAVGPAMDKPGVLDKNTPPVGLELLPSWEMLMSSGECRPLNQVQFL
ncbi:hypothetical protein PGT21_017902 [Puccinia graminis f. sp. tritici]|uniref:Uncharacterized protein n=1 Tax=Puccinia graminis f. sp. tritici TaxID=56615 RepID=A0A5B0M1Z4_PUCGR|nr:hypothetical protein PGT21_017902 [Puccinia graminis f. sp. tritici]KAA1089794.1 hypothetical protein PGTUg99_012482 [Puccinia graminis f. sp. tritici]